MGPYLSQPNKKKEQEDEVTPKVTLPLSIVITYFRSSAEPAQCKGGETPKKTLTYAL